MTISVYSKRAWLSGGWSIHNVPEPRAFVATHPRNAFRAELLSAVALNPAGGVAESTIAL